MKAFLRLDNGYIVKVYEHTQDWQVIDSNGNERWCSIWNHNGQEKESLVRAINVFMEQETDLEERFEDFQITK